MPSVRLNLFELDLTQALVAASKRTRRPIMLGIAARHWAAANVPLLAPVLQRLAESCIQPVGPAPRPRRPGTSDLVRAALDLGFTGIMFDGSVLSLQENITRTAAVVDLARCYGADVEGELGGIAGEEGVADTSGVAERGADTDPGEAARFACETGVAALALACGTADGIYAAAPEISFGTIRAVREATGLPLVLHGSTGVRAEDLRRCVGLGIAKVNFSPAS